MLSQFDTCRSCFLHGRGSCEALIFKPHSPPVARSALLASLLTSPSFLLPSRRLSNFAIDGNTETPKGSWFFSFTFALVCVTIVSGSLAERTHLMAYPAITVVIVTFVHPATVHWAWHSDTWLGKVSDCGFLDFAGGTTVHVVGARPLSAHAA